MKRPKANSDFTSVLDCGQKKNQCRNQKERIAAPSVGLKKQEGNEKEDRQNSDRTFAYSIRDFSHLWQTFLIEYKGNKLFHNR